MYFAAVGEQIHNTQCRTRNGDDGSENHIDNAYCLSHDIKDEWFLVTKVSIYFEKTIKTKK